MGRKRIPVPGADDAATGQQIMPAAPQQAPAMPGMGYPLMGMQQQPPGPATDMPNMVGHGMSGSTPLWHGNASVPSASSSNLAVASPGGMMPFPAMGAAMDVQSMQKAAGRQPSAWIAHP